MSFDGPTRNALAQMVGLARERLKADVQEQFRRLGLQDDGTVLDLAAIHGLSELEREASRQLRDLLEHLAAQEQGPKARRCASAHDRMAREIAFTSLNRLVALRMAEERGFIVESVRKGFASAGFQVYEGVANGALGGRAETYRAYVEAMHDEIAVDLPVLFDRSSPESLIFPSERALEDLFELLDDPALVHLWKEDETIGWVYQYYNDPAERKKMRESRAPRNSRELAVRNQFFTPRYVVEFLTDNTLGRVWHEMTLGKSRLKDQCHYLVRRPNEIFLQPGEAAPEQPRQDTLSQEQLLQQPVHIPHRSLKDPREIRMLDPACGSMHFGLYAFDLFEVIYDEAWEIAHGSDEARKSSASFVSFVSFVIQYPGKAAFLADVPRLIIEHNLHGIDIDPRAVQIAGLSLWLRAQRSWQTQRLRPQDRPRIRHSNIVCAEPMPGEEVFLDEFIEAHLSAMPEHKLLGQLVRRVFDAMKLAGEAGSLLKIEEDIAGAVREAKQKWLAAPKLEQGRLFADDTGPPAQKELGLDVTGITDETFWEKAEERIYAALQAYAERAEHGGGYQRRLFADDAARGFAFVDLCRKRYDVVVLNPPFGLMPEEIFRYLLKEFPSAYSDLALSFMVRGLEWLNTNGLVGAITSRAFLNVADAEKFRRTVAVKHLRIIADLGIGVMDDAFVDASAQVLSSRVESEVWIKDARRIADKARPLREFYLQDSDAPFYLIKLADFESIPRFRLAYDSGEGLGALLSLQGAVEPVYGIARTGASTFEDERFLRVICEVPPRELGPGKTWCWIARTAPDFCQYYHPYEIASKWNGDGAELCERNRQVNGQVAQARQGSTYYFRRGVVFSRRSRPSIAFRVHPSNCVFSSTCGVLFLSDPKDALFLMGVLNSRYVRAAVHTLTTYSYTVGHIRAIVAPSAGSQTRDAVATCALRLVHAKQECFRYEEGDHFFVPEEVDHRLGLRANFQNTVDHLRSLESQMLADSEEVDRITATIYQISAAVDTSRFGIVARNIELPKWLTRIDFVHWIESHLSEVVGCTLGRWDIRFATGEKPAPELPDPFAPLPVCPPGQLQNEKGLPMTKEEVGRLKDEGRWSYPIEIPWDGILVDDAGHPLDLEARVHQVLQVIWKDRWEAIEREACEILGVRTFRDYFRKPAGFFADHLKRYSKSRRQAPIYWPLSTASGSYTLWVYYHRLTSDTLFIAVNRYVEPKMAEVRQRLAQARAEADKATGKEAARLRGESEDAQKLLAELNALRAEMLRIAALPYRPDLNDGVIINAAPFHRLFQLPHWAKDTREVWEKLGKGDYDWAHLAMVLWPERVRGKCRVDRSLAIAHDLETLYPGPVKAAGKKRGKKAAPPQALEEEP